MSTVISTINLKGGVAKTTTTVALAEMLSAEFRKRVLVIDLDPQTNATVMLIGESEWARRNREGHTLAQLFSDALEDPSDRQFNLSESLIRGVSSVSAVQTVDLLPSSIDLIDVQDRLASMPSGRFYSAVPTEVLYRTIRSVLDDYDYVLIDCPPNLGIITLNGLRISTGYIIPTIPDLLSTYGIPQITKRVSDFSAELNENIEPMGIVITKFRAQSGLHGDTVNMLRRRPVHVFQTIIPERQAIAASAEFAQWSTLRQKYGYQTGEFDSYRALTCEFVRMSQNGAA